MKLLNFTEIKFQYTENVSWACLEFLTSLGVKNINWALSFYSPKFCPWWERTVGETKLSTALRCGIWEREGVIEGCTLYRIWALVRWLFLNLQVTYAIINSFSHSHFFQISTLFIEKKKEKKKGDWESKWLIKWNIPRPVPRPRTRVFWVRPFNSRYGISLIVLIFKFQ